MCFGMSFCVKGTNTSSPWEDLLFVYFLESLVKGNHNTYYPDWGFGEGKGASINYDAKKTDLN